MTQSILMELLYTISSISNGSRLENKKNKCTECILEFGFCGSGSGSNCRKNSIEQTKSTVQRLLKSSLLKEKRTLVVFVNKQTVQPNPTNIIICTICATATSTKIQNQNSQNIFLCVSESGGDSCLSSLCNIRLKKQRR